MFATAAVLLLGPLIVASPLLTMRALQHRSWVIMWAAALVSLVAGSVMIFSLGGIVFLLMNLQVAAAYNLRRGLPRTDTLTPLVLAALLWVMIVPVQAFGPVWFGGFGYLPLAALIVLGVLLIPIDWTASQPALAH
jgi:hypothetical protein